MPNRLINANSPYLLQHAENPVDWYPWGEEALQKAADDDKPIFLSIGYAACHWCHVMAHESFEDPSTADILNNYFVCIKVDREERPDLDSIYMDAVVAITGNGGWPMSVFLTPQGKPFHGGTYFPPVRRFNMPSFKEVLLAIAQAWLDNRNSLVDHAEKLLGHISRGHEPAQESGSIQASDLEQAASRLLQAYDWQKGGWGRAPKFPQPQLIEFLLRRGTRGDSQALKAALHALKAMAQGGMADLVAGGFSRYSTDDVWLVPHFEKMLYDNALLARAYLHAYLITGDETLRKICQETLDFIQSEMTHPDGGFFSSLDADSEGIEGKFYVWEQTEIASILEPAGLSRIFSRAYGITGHGNFESKNIIRRQVDSPTLAEEFGISVDSAEQSLHSALDLLRTARGNRIRPATDDKILLVWNALAMTAFAEAGRYLGRSDYTYVAMRNYEFIAGNLIDPTGLLLRSWRNGHSGGSAFLEDYAALILGCLALYQAQSDPKYYAQAHTLTETMLKLFRDGTGTDFYDTPIYQNDLIIRPKSTQDGATPSGISLAAEALLKMAAFSGNSAWRGAADMLLGSLAQVMVEYPSAFGNWLCAADYALGPALEIALIGSAADPAFSELKRVLDTKYAPNIVVAASGLPIPDGSPVLLVDRPLKDGKPTAYVCQNFTCKLPVNQPGELKLQLDEYLSVLKS